MRYLIILLIPLLMASKPMAPKQKQDQAQTQGQTQVASSSAIAGASASAAQDQANQQNITSNYETQAPDIILVPNNNTANCQKVYGLSFSTVSGGAGIGWPYRDKSCDFEQAADDAAANGQHTIAWFWRCHKKNLYKQFKAKHKEKQIQACHSNMMSMFVKEKPPVVINCDHAKKHDKIFEACQEK